MNFTYEAYRDLLQLLRNSGYVFTDYHEYMKHPKCVIMRHDVDNDLDQAVRLAKIEEQEGIKSTYFLLLRTDFYNPASAKSIKAIEQIQSMGHEIGLHFDELAYSDGRESIEDAIVCEKKILSQICGCDITTVSMHRPSKQTLQSNLQIPGMINSYDKIFFSDFKYLSDSRREWREPVLDVVRQGIFDRLHILTHAFWYHEDEYTISKVVRDFVCTANQNRYQMMSENIRDIGSIMRKDEC